MYVAGTVGTVLIREVPLFQVICFSMLRAVMMSVWFSVVSWCVCTHRVEHCVRIGWSAVYEGASTSFFSSPQTEDLIVKYRIKQRDVAALIVEPVQGEGGWWGVGGGGGGRRWEGCKVGGRTTSSALLPRPIMNLNCPPILTPQSNRQELRMVLWVVCVHKYVHGLVLSVC